MFSESATIQDLINRFMQISGATIDATKIDVRNQASEKMLRPEFVCKGLSPDILEKLSGGLWT